MFDRQAYNEARKIKSQKNLETVTPTKESYAVLQATDKSENDIFESLVDGEAALGGPELDMIVEEDLKRQPKKFTVQCTMFLLTIISLFILLKWVKIKISQSKDQDSQLDIMMKRQILESPAFKNCLQHYEDNICVQYASEEEFMTIQRLKEQSRINMKTMIEREKAERNE